MDIGSISSVKNLYQYQTVGNSASRPTKDGAGIAGTVDTAEISPEGRAAYLKKKAEESPEYRNMIAKLSGIQKEVLAHEQAHMAAGGSVAGAASYSYTEGPDGKQYITGGEVPISMPQTGDKEQMLHDLEQAKKAALAPAKPSGQDLSVAAEAGAQISKLRSEMAAEKIKEAKGE
jgi:hypothetical protein